jgi:CRP-like cAMP-binding protein
MEREPPVVAAGGGNGQHAAARLDGAGPRAGAGGAGRALADGCATGTVDRVLDWLRASQFCDGVEDEVLFDVAREVNVRAFQAGEVLACAGEEVMSLMVLADGAVKATFRDVKGHEHVLGYVNPGDHAGDVALLERTPRPVTFVALSAGTLLEVPAAAFHRLVDTHARLFRNLFRALGGRLREVAGMARRRPSSPVLAVAGTTPRMVVLVRRLVGRLADGGERLCVWSDEPDKLSLGERFPVPRPVGTDLPAAIRRFREDFPAGVDRHVVVTLAENWRGVDPRGVIAADDVFWVIEPTDHDRARHQWRETAAAVPGLADRTRRVCRRRTAGDCARPTSRSRWGPIRRSLPSGSGRASTDSSGRCAAIRSAWHWPAAPPAAWPTWAFSAPSTRRGSGSI